MKTHKINKSDNEDLRWVRKTRQGNQKAFEKLVIKYQKPVYALVRKMVLNHNDTNDIVQETFVKAYTGLDGFDEKHPFYPWLFRIATNTALNFIKKAQRYRETFSSDMGQENDKRSNSHDPLNDMIQDEYKKQIALALEKLPMKQRIVFILRTSQELSYQEISEQLNISLGTVMSRLSRAREKLKEFLLPYLETKDS